MSKEKVTKFNPERLLRSLGFTCAVLVKDNNTGEWKEGKDDWGTSRLYDHPLGYRIDITYDDNTARKPENIVYYMFRDNQHQYELSDWLEKKKEGELGWMSGVRLEKTQFNKDLLELNNKLKALYHSELLANPELQKYITTFKKVDCYGFRGTYGTARHLSMDWWLETFEQLGWDVDQMKENKNLV